MKKLTMSFLTVSALLWGTSFSTPLETNILKKKSSRTLLSTVTGPTYIYSPCESPYEAQYGIYYKNDCPCSGSWGTDFPAGVSCVAGGGTSSSMTLRFANGISTTSFGVEYGDCGCDLTVYIEGGCE